VAGLEAVTTPSPARGLALAGFMGVGKTTVGRRLAMRVGLPFCDLDALLTERFGPIAAQWAEVGEAGFRAREAALVAELCDGTPRVVALGGGTWVDPKNRARLREHYRAIVLDAPLEVVRQRIGSGEGRPLAGELAERYAARREVYQDADLIVDATLPIEVVIDRIVEHEWK
jgi:shikimate kinase